MKMTRIVITCGSDEARKAAIKGIRERLERMSYAVLVVPNADEALRKGGVSPSAPVSGPDFQECRVKLQLQTEGIFADAAKTMCADKLLIVCDGGAMDVRAEMDAAAFNNLLAALNTNEVELRDGYDAVFCLPSDACPERGEADDTSDSALISAWTGHPHLRVIGGASDPEERLEGLLREICFFLGEPEPLEIERKFLIEYPDLEWLERLPNCRRVDILQTYLKGAPGITTRVRQRGHDGHYIYIETIKKHITNVKRVEIERRVSREEYLRLLMDADPMARPIRKSRYCLVYAGQYFELDVFPFWNDRALLELEMCDETADIRFPEGIRVIREVTEEDMYKNANLARMRF